MPKRRLCKAGFTLMELAVIVVIMFTMAAVLAPAFRIAAARDKLAGCQGNLRELGTALHLYTGDYDGLLPTSAVHGALLGGTIPAYWRSDYSTAFCTVTGPPGDPVYKPIALHRQLYWMNVLYPYARDANVLWCPADPYAWYRNVPMTALNKWASYFWRGAVDVAWFGGTSKIPSVISRRVSDYAFPAQQCVLWERAPFHESAGSLPVQNGSKINMLFMDGHADLKVIRDCVALASGDPVNGWYHNESYAGEPFFYNYNTNTEAYWSGGTAWWWDPHIYRDNLETAN